MRGNVIGVGATMLLTFPLAAQQKPIGTQRSHGRNDARHEEIPSDRISFHPRRKTRWRRLEIRRQSFPAWSNEAGQRCRRHDQSQKRNRNRVRDLPGAVTHSLLDTRLESRLCRARVSFHKKGRPARRRREVACPSLAQLSGYFPDTTPVASPRAVSAPAAESSHRAPETARPRPRRISTHAS